MEWFKFYHNKWLTDPAILSLKPHDRLIFVTLLCLASQTDERDGVVRYVSNEALRSVTLVRYADKNDVDSDGVEALQKVGLVELIDAQTLRICNFEKRQNTALTNAERQKLYRQRNKSVTERNERYNDSNAREEKIREDKNINIHTNEPSYSKSFLKFWEAYPKKVGKGAAYRAFKRAKLPPIEELLAILSQHTTTEQWTAENGKYVPNPATWLNQNRWEDELQKNKPQGTPIKKYV